MNNDLISRNALKKAFEKVYPLATNEMGGVVNKQIYDIINNAPAVERSECEMIGGNNMVKFSEFRSCEKDPPEKDGVYVVFHFIRSEYLPLTYKIYTVEYTVAYGWNTSSANCEHVMRFNEGEVWCEVTDFSGCPVWNLDTRKVEIFETSSECNNCEEGSV